MTRVIWVFCLAFLLGCLLYLWLLHPAHLVLLHF